jgi:DNA-binding transcriptional regulator GbsR (MarR family)
MNNDKEKIKKIQDYIIEETTHYMEFVGAKKMIGRVFGLLMSHVGAMSLSEMSERLQVSKPAVSNTMKIGVQSELFRKRFNPDSPREDYYELSKDWLSMIIDPGLKKLSIFIENYQKGLDKINEETDNNPQGYLKELYEKLEYTVRALHIVVEEYEKFGKSLNQRLKEIK